jgi:hypothetical protein
MYAVVVTFDKRVFKIVPISWLLNVCKKTLVKTNTYITYYCNNIFTNANFEGSDYKKTFDEKEGLYKVYVCDFFGKWL